MCACVPVGALRRMLSLKQQLEEKIVAVEILSRQLVANDRSVVAEGSATPPVGVVSSVQLDPDTVDRAITGLLAVVGKVRDVSQLVGVCVCVCVWCDNLFMDCSEVMLI